MTTYVTAHGLCYCAGPWRESLRVPPRLLDRAHIPSLLCERLEDQRPKWLARIKPKELAR